MRLVKLCSNKIMRTLFMISVVCFFIGVVILWIKLAQHLEKWNTPYDSLVRDGSLINAHSQIYQNNNPTGILLLTYRRSGSSVVGELLQKSKDVFYVFEPLQPLYKHFHRLNKPIRWLNGTVSQNGTYNVVEVHKLALEGLLTCNFSKVYAAVFENFQFLQYGMKTSSFYNCALNKYRSFARDSESGKLVGVVNKELYKSGLNEPCLRELKQACLRSKTRIVKTIRTSVFIAEQVYQKTRTNIKLKIIHLIRDPRSIIMSTKQLLPKSARVDNLARSVCFFQWNDTVTMTHVSVPVLTVFYENLVSNPVNETMAMYQFIGLGFTDIISKYTTELVLHRNVSGCIICKTGWQNQIKHNNTKIQQWQDVWKTDFDLTDISNIQFHCLKILTYYGYQIYDQVRASKRNYSSTS